MNNIIKHNKIKNTGLLFETMVRMITLDVINGKKSKLVKVLKKYFPEKTEMGKELSLYNILIKEKNNDLNYANSLLEAVLTSRNKLNANLLKNEKYNLIKEISELGYNIEEMTSLNIDNYKSYASIYKIFKGIEEKLDNNAKYLVDFVNIKNNILENIRSNQNTISETVNNTMVEDDDAYIDNYNKQSKTIKMVGYNLVVKQFNEKYGNINESQRMLIKKYIQNTLQFDKGFLLYIKEELLKSKNIISELSTNVSDEIVKIKLEETYRELNKKNINEIKKVEDGHISLLLNLYDLQDEMGK